METEAALLLKTALQNHNLATKKNIAGLQENCKSKFGFAKLCALPHPAVFPLYIKINLPDFEFLSCSLRYSKKKTSWRDQDELLSGLIQPALLCCSAFVPRVSQQPLGELTYLHGSYATPGRKWISVINLKCFSNVRPFNGAGLADLFDSTQGRGDVAFHYNPQLAICVSFVALSKFSIQTRKFLLDGKLFSSFSARR